MITTEVVLVTPSMASKWLAANNQSNRNIRKAVAERYASDMATGRWILTHQGIAFYENGQIADGQHRLAAIVKANVSIRMYVSYGIPNDAATAIDGVAPRSACDSIRIKSLMSNGVSPSVNGQMIATTRVMMSLLQVKPRAVSTLTVTAIEDYIDRHRDVIEFGLKHCSSKKRTVTKAVVMANVNAAYYSNQSVSHLDRFMEVMLTGESLGRHENSAIRLREWMFQHLHSGKVEIAECRRVQSAIKSFVNERPIEKLCETNQLMFFAPDIEATKWNSNQ